MVFCALCFVSKIKKFKDLLSSFFLFADLKWNFSKNFFIFSLVELCLVHVLVVGTFVSMICVKNKKEFKDLFLFSYGFEIWNFFLIYRKISLQFFFFWGGVCNFFSFFWRFFFFWTKSVFSVFLELRIQNASWKWIQNEREAWVLNLFPASFLNFYKSRWEFFQIEREARVLKEFSPRLFSLQNCFPVKDFNVFLLKIFFYFFFS